MDIGQLRETITQLLSASPSLVGEYTLPGGNVIPAIYVVGRQSVPKEWKAKGLEVTIRERPERLPSVGIGTLSVNQLWEVILVQYTPSSNTLEDAMERIIRRFPDCTPRYFRGDDVAYERCRITIPDRVIRRLHPELA